ncbi:MAG: capsule biosynthesis protein [Paracoccaceae bacterium]
MARKRKFLFLQGPHGPFFSDLAAMLEAAGHEARRVGFNGGDAAFWPWRRSYRSYTGSIVEWPGVVERMFDEEGFTDLVVYGDARPFHRFACEAAQIAGARVHFFEEGYLRPYWVTYERDGVNGNSRLSRLGAQEIAESVRGRETRLPDAPDQWGALWHHVWYGFRYHASVLLGSGRYRSYMSHRQTSLGEEALRNAVRLMILPSRSAYRRLATRRLLRFGAPFHVVLLQLSHDASVQFHSDFSSMSEFVVRCLDAFAAGAPKHHHLVFKGHPLDDGREPLRRIISRQARIVGLSGRVWYLPGGKLGALLDRARSAVTINSTAAQQALWRGLPVKALGRAVFVKPEFVSSKTLSDFFAAPDAPDTELYRLYRQFLLETSQIPGGFYTRNGRAEVLRHAVDLMLADSNPYAAAGRDGRDRRPRLVHAS